MSALASILAQGGSAVDEVTTADRVRDAATLTSITLAILSAFATQRATALAKQDGNLGSFTADDLKRDLGVDAGLVVFGVLLLIAAGPLFVAAAGEATPLFRVDTSFFALFCLFYLGVVLVVVWASRTAWKRAGFLKTKTSASNRLSALFA
ncbi:MAG TPA: hypothetical protein VK471_09970 [Solirubrobacterales bacterium]|nr:hypothetical protein [Solirubrobacterales bacterium]